MNEQNIMENNEVLEVAEEVVDTKSGLGVKILIGALATVGAIYGGMKLKKKLKSKKDEDVMIVDADEDQPIVESGSVGIEENEKKNKKKN